MAGSSQTSPHSSSSPVTSLLDNHHRRHAMANDAATATVSPVVETVSGKLRGLAAGGIFAFKGVPYGADTGGANRFMPPFPPPPWTGVREAFAYRGQAPQAPDRARRRPELETVLGPADATPEGEDCLTLNIWTPGLDVAKRDRKSTRLNS